MRRRDLRLKHRGWRALGHHQKLLQTGRRIVVAMSAAARRIVSPTEVEPVGRRRRARRCSGAATMLGSGSHYFRCNISVLQMPQSASRYVQQTTASAAAARVDAQRIRPPEACHCMRSCVVVLGVWSKFRHVISCCDNFVVWTTGGWGKQCLEMEGCKLGVFPRACASTGSSASHRPETRRSANHSFHQLDRAQAFPSPQSTFTFTSTFCRRLLPSPGNYPLHLGRSVASLPSCVIVYRHKSIGKCSKQWLPTTRMKMTISTALRR
jgi:hypothetical protein